MKRAGFFLAVLCAVLVGWSASAQTTYTWNQTGTASWATAANWTPTRTTPAANDVLVFDNAGATLTVTNVPTQTIGRLSVATNTAVNLQSAAAVTLSVAGGAGDDLVVAAGAQLNQTATVAANAITVALAAGATGNISGSMTFTGAGAGTAHRLTAASASGITFQSGAALTQGAAATGNAFGTTSLNSVIFANGSRYVSLGGGANPFGAGAPSSVVVFQTGSTYVQQGSATPSFSNRTYANFELNKSAAGAINVTGGSSVVMDNLTITLGTLNFNMTGTPGHTINGDISVVSGTLSFSPATAATVNLKGDITVASGATLSFAPTVSANFVLNGTSVQTLANNGGTINVANANQTITFDNPSGVNLLTPITVNNGTLALTSGTVGATANILTIGANANVTRTNGYVIGTLGRTFAAPGSKLFPVGTPNGYSPFTANVTAGTFPADIAAAAVQGAQPNMAGGTSILRYWSLGGTGVTADLTFQYLDGDVQGNEALYKVYRVSGGTPVAFPGSSVDTGTNTATVTGISSFSDWTVGEFGDTTAPTVTGVTLPADDTYVTGENLDFVVSFSEPVVVTGGPRIPITLTTGTAYANYLSGSGSTALTFRYTVATGEADADGISLGALDFNGGSIDDASGNDAETTLNGLGSTAGILVDAVAPAVSASTVPANDTYITGENLDFSITYDQPVVVTGAPSVALTLDTGGTVQAVYDAGASTSTTLVFRYTVAAGNADIDGVAVASAISLNAGTIQDAAGNNAATSVTFGSTAAVLVDGIAPTVSSITRVGSASTNAASLDFTVQFSEDVTGVTTAAFELHTPDTATGTISNVVAVDGDTYTVTVSSVTGEGTLRLDVKSSGTGITDTPGNPLSGGFTTGEAYTVDHVAPTVTSVAVPADGTYTVGQNLDFTVNFSENVTVTGAPRIAITEASGTVYATYLSGSGTSALLFRNTVVAGDSDPDGIELAASIDLNGGTLQDAAANDANTTLNSVGSTTGVLVDANAPSVVSVTRVHPATTNLASVDYTVTFSQSVTGVDATDFSFTLSGVTGASVTNVTPASGDVYTVTVNTGTGDGTLRLNVDNDGTIQNGTSIPLSAPFTGGEVYAIDKTAPAVQSIARVGAATTNASTIQFTVTFTEPVSNVGTGDFTVTAGGSVTGASVTGISGTGPFTVDVATGSGDGTIRLDVAGASATINDAAGNALTADFNTGDVTTIDKSAPSVQSIARANTDPTSAASVDFTVTFNEPVTGVDAADFALAASGVSSPSITSVTGSGPYTVTVNTGSGSGTLGLNLADDDSIADAAGNLLGGTGNGNGNFTGQVYTVQKAPLAPANLTATSGLDSHVPLTWDAANGATTYNVKRSPTNNTSYTTIASGVAVTNYDDTTAVNGTTYFYKVSATNGQGEGPDSNEVSATPSAPLAPPSPVTAAVGDARVILSWPAVSGATSYNVKRGTTSGSYTVTTSAPSNTFTDTTVSNGTTYFYVVTSVGGSESTPSAEVSATPNTPSVLGVVISQVYGGGGNAGATLKNDFVELFNRGTQTVSLTGWFVHYTSAASGTWTASNSPTALSGTIAPGRYYLVQEAAGASGTVDLPAADAVGNIAMGATGGRVALVGAAGGLSGCPSGTFLADFVGYGAAATCFEGSGPTPSTSNTSSVVRANGGCTDTNNNSADFSVVAQPLTPRNSATPANTCSGGNNPPNINAPADPIASVSQDAAPFNVNLTGTDDGGVFTWSATPGSGVQSVTVNSGQNTASVSFTVTLVAGFSGTATFTASLSDGVNAPDTQAVNIQVTGIGGNSAPLITPPNDPITTVAQDPAPFTVNLAGSDDGGVYNWTATPGTGVTSVTVSAGQGTPNVTYTVTLNAGFSGTATFTASLSDNVNPADTQAVNISVTPAGATPDHIVISQVYGGGGNSGATYKNDYIELFNPTASAVNVTGWSVQYSSATNTGSFSGLQPIGGSIGPGQYYLISLASGGDVGSDLPTPNVSGSINMSGTTGKVALVRNGDVLAGPCVTTLADPDLVDLVGYGTANCNEGGSNAPAPSNTTAAFRKNGGNTDTNVNGNDFLSQAPNPRSTAPLSEFGPAVVNTDPVSNASNAPRDANIIVTFTEPVDVDTGWYDITCTTTGNHNDATVSPGAPNSYVIIPNVNFLAAEQCTVTIFAAFVHDTDLDDSGPNTDTLAANYSWTFTVATGTAPPYPASVHLTMGNPSDAAADLLMPNNYLMEKPEMAISYNADRGTPNWVSWHLTDEWVGSLTRVDTFRADPEVPPTWYRVLGSDYFGSGFDRGHNVPNADRDKETSIPINQATFLMTNMLPQAPDNNQGPWANMENDLRLLLPANELYIVMGGAGTGGTGSNGFATTIANGHVTVPAQTWKVVLILPKASGDDVARVTASTRTLAVLMPNVQGIRNNDWEDYIVTVDHVESVTGYDFFPNVPDAIEASIESGTDGDNPPGAADQSVSATEDQQKDFTLSAVSPSNGTLTYTIVTNPSHGTLSGSGASRSYTPVPNYFGSDSFTYRVNDGTGDSNIATVTITVAEVNDAPVAADDSKTATGNTPLTFNASDLTVNDNAGPNEGSQTLTVASVTNTADTHGAVVLNAGQVTYTPAPGYTGPASFTYSVCDNGTTNGVTQSLCASATVNVTVNAAPPAPVATHFLVTAPASVTNGVPFNVTVTARDASNATVTGYTGTVHFTSSSTGALPGDYTFVAGDNGSHTFSVTLTTNGAQTITATDTANPSINGTATTSVECDGPPSAIAPIAAPSEVCAGSTGNSASTSATGSSYTWTITNGIITAGQGTASITFTAGASGETTLHVVVGDTCGSQQTGDATVAIRPLPDATLPADIHACPGSTVNITVLLTGTAPFTVRWSDGLVQSNVNSSQVTRSVVVAQSVTNYQIDSVTDAFCTRSPISDRVRVIPDAKPVIVDQTRHAKIKSGQTAPLSVVTSTNNVSFQWYQGTFGDTTRPVGSNTATFTTPALTATTHYWVRLTSACGTTDSQPMVVTVSGKRRSARS